MTRSQLRIVLAVIGVAVAAMVVLLLTGGNGEQNAATPAEGTGDVVLGAGEQPPTETALADINQASVTASAEDEYVFSASFGAPVPKKLEKQQTFSFRWDITAPDGNAFIVSGNLDVGPNVSIVATQSRYGASSLDDSFPGEMTIEGDTWTITIDGSEIEGWPTDFTWKLKTSMDGLAGDPESALVEDTAPNEGFGTIIRA